MTESENTYSCSHNRHSTPFIVPVRSIIEVSSERYPARFSVGEK